MAGPSTIRSPTAAMSIPILRQCRLQLGSELSRPGLSAKAGFSLVEVQVLAAVLLVTVVLASTTVSGLIGNRAGRHLASADELEHLIQRDLAVIRELNSCCTEDCNAAESMIRAFPPPPVAPPGVSLKRSRPTLDNPATNRLQLTYAVSTAWEQLISRVVNIVPSQPKVCP